MINPLKSARCYLSGPIENDESKNHNWRVEPTKVMIERFGVDVFDPFNDPKQQWTVELYKARDACDYEEMTRIAHDFVSKDLIMVEKADFLVAYLPKGVSTCGTHHEIIFSSNNKKPTLLVCPQGKQHVPLWYYGFIPHTCMFGSWDGLYNYLQEVVDWKHSGNKRWKYRYGLI
jgi:nucleoside 2-deoxyribosyltransferase